MCPKKAQRTNGKHGSPKHTEPFGRIIPGFQALGAGRCHGVGRGIHRRDQQDKSCNKPSDQYKPPKGQSLDNIGDQHILVTGMIEGIEKGTVGTDGIEIKSIQEDLTEAIIGNGSKEEERSCGSGNDHRKDDRTNGTPGRAFCNKDPHDRSQPQPPGPVKYSPFLGEAAACSGRIQIEEHLGEMLQAKAKGLHGIFNFKDCMTENQKVGNESQGNVDAKLGQNQNPLANTGTGAPGKYGGDHNRQDEKDQEIFGNTDNYMGQICQGIGKIPVP